MIMKLPTIKHLLKNIALLSTLSMVTLAIYAMTFGKVTFGLYVTPPMLALLTASYCLVVVATVVLFSAKRVVLLLSLPIYFLTLLCGIAMFILIFGTVQDSLGVRCTGFFGVSVACIDNSVFGVSFVLLNPILIIPLSLVITLSLAFGLWQQRIKRTE